MTDDGVIDRLMERGREAEKEGRLEEALGLYAAGVEAVLDAWKEETEEERKRDLEVKAARGLECAERIKERMATGGAGGAKIKVIRTVDPPSSEWQTVWQDVYAPIDGCPVALVYGPEGRGLEEAVEAMAYDKQATLMWVNASDLLAAEDLRESTPLVKEMFVQAQIHCEQDNNDGPQPVVLGVKGVDVLAREEDESAAAKRVKTEFLVQLQAASTTDDVSPGVCVVCTTHKPWVLDRSLRRRFGEACVYIGDAESVAVDDRFSSFS